MTRQFFINLGRAAIWLVCLASVSVFAAGSKRSGKSAEAVDELFANDTVLRIRLEIPEAAMAVLRKASWQFGPQQEREAVHVTVREGGRVYTNVSLHLKGAAGSFRPVDSNPCFTLNFEKFSPGQRFHGLKKLSLNNSVQDPTFVSEQLSRELFLQAGVPVPRASHAKVQLNDRDLGLYVLTEGYDRQFLKRHFKNTSGNLYDGGFLKDVSQELSVNSGEDSKDQSDRVALMEAAREPNLTNRLARLQRVLDLDRFLTFVALDVMLWDWDGYAMNKNNWRLYHDRDQDKMVFMPHGLDQLFWKPDGPMLPPMQGLVARSVLQIPELRTRYFERAKQLHETVFNVQSITNRVHEIAARIRPVLAEKDAETAKEHDRAILDYCQAIVRRGRSLSEQLAHPAAPLAFDGAGVAVLSGWEAKPQFGHPTLDQKEDSGRMLKIGTTQGSSIGSWRTKVWLEPGRYRIEGKIRTEGILADAGDPRGGASIRTGSGRAEKPILGTSNWQVVSNEFGTEDPLAQVEVICEFRGVEGEAVFDAGSIQLKKISASR